MKKVTTLLVAASLATISSAPVLACGESLFRVGKGLTYREYTAPIPGHVVIVARSPAETAMAEALAAAGHHVQVVDSAAELGAALADHDADVVLMYADEAAVIAALLHGTDTALLPVARPGDAPGAANMLRADDNVKTFLRAIHRSLKAKRA